MINKCILVLNGLTVSLAITGAIVPQARGDSGPSTQSPPQILASPQSVRPIAATGVTKRQQATPIAVTNRQPSAAPTLDTKTSRTATTGPSRSSLPQTSLAPTSLRPGDPVQQSGAPDTKALKAARVAVGRRKLVAMNAEAIMAEQSQLSKSQLVTEPAIQTPPTIPGLEPMRPLPISTTHRASASISASPSVTSQPATADTGPPMDRRNVLQSPTPLTGH